MGSRVAFGLLPKYLLEKTPAAGPNFVFYLIFNWNPVMPPHRYMFLHVYTQRDKFHPKYHPVVLDQQLRRPLVFPNFAEPICFSASGRYCILVTKREFSIKREPFLQPDNDKGKEEDNTKGDQDGSEDAAEDGEDEMAEEEEDEEKTGKRKSKKKGNHPV